MTRLSALTVIKSTAFVIVGIIAAVLVSNTLRVPVQGPTTTYRIQFTDAEGLIEGNPVTMSGVRIGRVQSVRFVPQEDGTSIAEVEVNVQDDHPLPQNLHAAVRYGDMLGARYIAVTEAKPGTDTQRQGEEIPITATSAPVNLTALMNGFQPLFSALDPKQVNTLAMGFTQTFEGREGSVQLLLKQIATMGSNLAANTAIFTRLITNLNTLMSTMDANNPRLTELFKGLGTLTSSIVGDNGQLAALLSSGEGAVGALASMMTASGDNFRQTLTGLNQVTQAWIPNTPAFTQFVKQLPVLTSKINQSGRYGGFMMLYLCNFTLKAFNLEANIFGPFHSPVCM